MQPSETKLGERISVLENEVRNIKEQNTCEHSEIKLMIKEFVESADRKYASKTSEKVVYGMVGIILTSVLYFILKSVGLK